VAQVGKKGAAVIEIAEGKDDKFRFFVRSAEAKLLARSSPTGFATEREARAAVEELKDALRGAKVVHTKKAKGKK
jgi:hypothetical protein